MNMKRRGRRSTLDQKLQRRICGLLSQGSAIKSACIVCGLGERTFYDWRDKGRAGEEPFARFFSAVTRAREAHKGNLIRRIVSAATADWKAASWLLERQFPGEFGRSEPRTIIIERRPQAQPNAGLSESVERRLWTTASEGLPLSKNDLQYLDYLRQHGEQRQPLELVKKNAT